MLSVRQELQFLNTYYMKFMLQRVNIQTLYVLPKQCIYVFCVDIRTNSHYFPIQH